MDTGSPLEAQFHEAMIGIYESAKREVHYTAHRFLEMVDRLGGVPAARRLVTAPNASDGYTRLWEEKRLDLSVEYLVLSPKFQPLFTEEERSLARQRLLDYGFPGDRLPD
jgi:hypothetical protein